MSFYREESNQKRKPNIIVRILGFIWSTIKGYFFTVGLFATLFPIIILAWMGSGGDSLLAPGKKDRASQSLRTNAKYVIDIDLEGPIQFSDDQDPKSLFKKLFRGEKQVSLPLVNSALRRAADDKRVVGMVMRLKDVHGSLYAMEGLRHAFEKVKAAGKPIYVIAEDFDTDLYFLGSVGDHLSLTPAGSMMLLGPVVQTMYFKSALDKLGVEMIAVKAGKYKSALESFVADGPSPETVEMYTTIEASLRNYHIAKAAEGRKKSPDVIRTWYTRSMYTAPEALEQGMVDRLAYNEDATNFALEQLQGDEFISLDNYAASSLELDEQKAAKGNEQIAFIRADGEIVQSSDDGDYDVITPKRLIKELRWAQDDTDVKSIVLHVDSPGGSALASDLIAEEVRKLTKKKPVIVSMGSVAASGGYYISAPATKIIADAGTITGSIGVIAALPKATQVKQKWGVTFHVITETAREALLNPAKVPSTEDRAILSGHIDWTYQTFLKVVADGRDLEVPKVHEMAQGRVYTGLQAKDLGLVDELGGLPQAFREAKIAAQLDPEKLYSIATYQEDDFAILECLRGGKALRRCIQQFGVWSGVVAKAGMPEQEAWEHIERSAQLLLPDHDGVATAQALTWWPQGSLVR